MDKRILEERLEEALRHFTVLWQITVLLKIEVARYHTDFQVKELEDEIMKTKADIQELLQGKGLDIQAEYQKIKRDLEVLSLIPINLHILSSSLSNSEEKETLKQLAIDAKREFRTIIQLLPAEAEAEMAFGTSKRSSDKEVAFPQGKQRTLEMRKMPIPPSRR